MGTTTTMTSYARASHAEWKWLTGAFRANATICRVLFGAVWPIVDLMIRVGLAQSVFVSGVLKATHWQTALELAASEYPVSWMSPTAAAYAGVSIELVAPILLACGLMTRYAAIPLLILTLVVQFDYRAFDAQLYGAALLGWYVIHGASALSLDRVLRRGLGASALPLAARLIRVSRWARTHLTPWYLALLRVWLCAALVPSIASVSSAWFPLTSGALFGAPISCVAATLLLAGLATRYLALSMVLTVVTSTMIQLRMEQQYHLLMVLGLLAVHGAGRISCDSIIDWWVRRRNPQLLGGECFSLEGLPRVVIVGAGFGGISCAVALRDTRVAITLVDRANYHLFQPLLYQVATAAITPSDIAVPIRSLFRDALNTTVLLDTVTDVDTGAKAVLIGDRKLPYDYLVVATGAAHSYFGKDQWAPFAPGLKRIEDATSIRARLLRAFELAEATQDASERDALLTFLVVGAGPTGVELAGAIAELSRFGMAKEFRHFDPARARVLLVQSGSRVLPTFDPRLSEIAHRSLVKLGVTILLDSRVQEIDADGVMVSDTRIVARTVLWAAGVKASPAATWLKCSADAAGRIMVKQDLGVAGLDGVYAIGDTAVINAWRGRPVPGLAPAAKQGGIYVARAIRADLAGKNPPAPFRYRHFGSLATIGRQSAVADFGVGRLWGAPAWWLWGCIHVGFLVGMRSRISTMLNWFWAYLAVGNGIKLITEPQPSAPSSRRD